MRKVVFGLLVTVCIFIFVWGCGGTKQAVVKPDQGIETKGEMGGTVESPEDDGMTKGGLVHETPIMEQTLKGERESAEQRAGMQEVPTFEDIYFDFDKYELSPQARDMLKTMGEWYRGYPHYEIIIEGHCDERGATEYNLALGERRAQAAASYLISLGIDKLRITTISYGEELPLDPRHCEEAWEKNRRVHFVTIPKK